MNFRSVPMPGAAVPLVPARERRVPALGTRAVRMALGAGVALAAPLLAAPLLSADAPGIGSVLALVFLTWLPAVWLTDKYEHKYPYRYLTYLLASHGKAVVIQVILGAFVLLAVAEVRAAALVLGLSVALAAVVDLLVALPSRVRAAPTKPITAARPDSSTVVEFTDLDVRAVLPGIMSGLPEDERRFLNESLPPAGGTSTRGRVIDDRDELKREHGDAALGLLVGRRPLNAVRRLNLYLQDCAAHVSMGGYVSLRYTPLDRIVERLRERVPGILFGPAFVAHFIWFRAIPKLPWLDVLYFSKPFAFLDRLFYRPSRGRKRVISRSEVWGRLAFYGFEVVTERTIGDECLLLARRVAAPVQNRRPSYYAVVALEKVGLDGEIIRLYKVRSMFPFSEFLQKKIFESHGLSATGKFKNDFRLTEYGPLIRSSWLDELPGIFNWVRGDVKLVGMRATSPHFLGLYPKSLYDRYVMVKPGLVPPIFDEKTAGFEQIVEVENTYLTRYLDAPVRTDIAYFWYTFRDIVFRRVRSH